MKTVYESILSSTASGRKLAEYEEMPLRMFDSLMYVFKKMIADIETTNTYDNEKMVVFKLVLNRPVRQNEIEDYFVNTLDNMKATDVAMLSDYTLDHYKRRDLRIICTCDEWHPNTGAPTKPYGEHNGVMVYLETVSQMTPDNIIKSSVRVNIPEVYFDKHKNIIKKTFKK